ncbi:MAG: hypothetical protein ACOY46_00705 [Bacillota bacterium]
MKRLNWYLILGVSLVSLSALIYLFHFALFKDPHHIFIYFIGDIAFLPIEVLLVSLVLHRLISIREKQLMQNNLNVVIGAFFSEVGTLMIKYLTIFEIPYGKSSQIVNENRGDIDVVLKNAERYGFRFDTAQGDLELLRSFLMKKRQFLLNLMENPNLLENESFTELLRSVFHLTEELEYRPDVKNLHPADRGHISDDMSRAFKPLVIEWIKYIKHLKENYPYLYSLAIRTNPFIPSATIEIIDYGEEN